MPPDYAIYKKNANIVRAGRGEYICLVWKDGTVLGSPARAEDAQRYLNGCAKPLWGAYITPQPNCLRGYRLFVSACEIRRFVPLSELFAAPAQTRFVSPSCA